MQVEVLKNDDAPAGKKDYVKRTPSIRLRMDGPRIALYIRILEFTARAIDYAIAEKLTDSLKLNVELSEIQTELEALWAKKEELVTPLTVEIETEGTLW